MMNSYFQRMENKPNSGRWNGNGRSIGHGNGYARGSGGRKSTHEEETRARSSRKPSDSWLEILNYEFGQNSNLVNWTQKLLNKVYEKYGMLGHCIKHGSYYYPPEPDVDWNIIDMIPHDSHRDFVIKDYQEQQINYCTS